MNCKNDVLMWFRERDCVERIEFVCDLFNCCALLEVQYFITKIKGICISENLRVERAKYQANELNYSRAWTKVEDPQTRNRLIVLLSFMKYSNHECADAVYEFLVERFPGEKFDWNEIAADKVAASQTELLLTLAVYHPAFTFTQKTYFFDLLEYLRHSGHFKKEDDFHVSDNVESVPTNKSSIPEKETLLKNEQGTTLAAGELCSFPTLEESRSVLIQKESPPSQSKNNNQFLQEELLSSVVKESEKLSSEQKLSGLAEESRKQSFSLAEESRKQSFSLAKEGWKQSCNAAIQNREQSLSNVNREKVSSHPPRKLEQLSAENEPSSHSSKGSDECVLIGPSDGNREKSSSCPPKRSVQYKPHLTLEDEEQPSSVSSDENNITQEKQSSSSLEGKKCVTAETSTNSSVTLPVVLNRSSVASRYGKIKNIELKGTGKKGTYRLQVAWSSGKRSEIYKTFKQLKNFQLKVASLASEFSTQNGNNKDITVLPGLSLSSFGEDVVEQFDKIANYLSDFIKLLPLPVRDHDIVVSFFQSPSPLPPRPILVGQGNLKPSLVDVPSGSQDFCYFPRSRHNENHARYPSRQYRNSTGSWQSPKDPCSFNQKKAKYGKWQFYPPISGYSPSGSPQSSRPGSSHNSRTSSPSTGRATNSTMAENAMSSGKNSKKITGASHNESNSSEVKSSTGQSAQYVNKKKDPDAVIIMTRNKNP